VLGSAVPPPQTRCPPHPPSDAVPPRVPGSPPRCSGHRCGLRLPFPGGGRGLGRALLREFRDQPGRAGRKTPAPQGSRGKERGSEAEEPAVSLEKRCSVACFKAVSSGGTRAVSCPPGMMRPPCPEPPALLGASLSPPLLPLLEASLSLPLPPAPARSIPEPPPLPLLRASLNPSSCPCLEHS